ncbi:MAG: SpoIID/LytB domain-containing protein [Trueperaceae bacterium]
MLLAGSWAQAQPLVRVLLGDELAQAQVAFAGPHVGAIDGRSFATPFALTWPVAAAAGELTVDGHPVGRVLELSSDEGVVWNGRRYRGSLRVLADGERVRVVNVVALEAYLRGVVPAEMVPTWPGEALRAQAVAARTYTLAHLDPDAAYDVCATDQCQVYRGRGAEHPATDAAVADTAGLVLTYAGAFASTYYHSDSGGVIASSAEVWGRDLPYLQAFQDVASDGPHGTWTARLTPERVAGTLRAVGHEVGLVGRMSVLATSASGRVLRAEFIGSSGRTVLEGLALRTALREWGLKSTRFTMTGDLSVRGEGWGHGVGMSQYGARELAVQGYGFAQILGFYYPHTTLQRVTVQAAR